MQSHGLRRGAEERQEAEPVLAGVGDMPSPDALGGTGVGGEGSRTPVLEAIYTSFYMFIRW